MLFISKIVSDRVALVTDTMADCTKELTIEEIRKSQKQVIGYSNKRLRAYSDADAVVRELNLRSKLSGGLASLFEYYVESYYGALIMHLPMGSAEKLNGREVDLVIPSYVDYYKASGFDAIPIKHLILENGVLGFQGDWTLRGSLIEELVLPDSFVSFSDNCFAMCDSLRRVHLSSNVEDIEGGCFCQCRNLELVTASEGTALLNIFSYAFSGCKKLKEVQGFSEATYVRSDAFTGCLSLSAEFKAVLKRAEEYYS